VRLQQLEARVLAAVEVVTAGGRIEDQLIECKREWPEPTKAARRIAGHANAARGTDITWIIGLDEDAHEVAGAGDTDLATWWPQVLRRFDEVAPDLEPLTVAVGGGKAVVALSFRTDRAPYSVTTDGQGGVQVEVPYRDGTTTRTARRHELLRMLLPAVAVPTLDLVTARLTFWHDPERKEEKAGNVVMSAYRAEQVSWRLDLSVFVDAADPTMLPEHRQVFNGHLHPPDGEPLELQASNIAAETESSRRFPYNPSGPRPTPPPIPERGAHVRWAGIYITGPDLIGFNIDGELNISHRQFVADAAFATLTLSLPLSDGDRRAVIDGRLKRDYSEDDRHERQLSRFAGGRPSALR